MRIVLLGQSGPYTPGIARRLLAASGDAWELVLAVEGTKTPRGRAHHKVYPGALATLPPSDRFREYTVAAGLPCLVTNDINAPWAVNKIASFAPDLLLCAGFDRLFAPSLLATSRLGGINCHPSWLPDLRGPSPLFWAARRGDAQLGVSVHMLDEREDHGAILAQAKCAMPSMETGSGVYRVAADLVATILLPVLEAAAAKGVLEGEPQEKSGACRAPRPGPDDARFNAADFGAQHLVNFVTTARDFRTCWTRMGGDPFFVERGIEAQLGRRLPGEYLQSGKELLVQCADGVARLEIQI